jgi:hypothetical protein
MVLAFGLGFVNYEAAVIALLAGMLMYVGAIHDTRTEAEDRDD